MRYTEYHDGKAVIKDKGLLSGAMDKLAKLEDMEQEGRYIQIVPKFSFLIPQEDGTNRHLTEGKKYHAIEKEDGRVLVLDDNKEEFIIERDDLTTTSYRVIR